MTKLYDIKRGSKIYEEVVTDKGEQPGSYLVFKRLDGAYSVCIAHDKEGSALMDDGREAIVHLSAATPLVAYKDGYKIQEES